MIIRSCWGYIRYGLWTVLYKSDIVRGLLYFQGLGCSQCRRQGASEAPQCADLECLYHT